MFAEQIKTLSSMSSSPKHLPCAISPILPSSAPLTWIPTLLPRWLSLPHLINLHPTRSSLSARVHYLSLCKLLALEIIQVQAAGWDHLNQAEERRPSMAVGICSGLVIAHSKSLICEKCSGLEAVWDNRGIECIMIGNVLQCLIPS